MLTAMYLLELADILYEGLEYQVRRATQILMEASVNLSDNAADQRRYANHIVPDLMEEISLFE